MELRKRVSQGQSTNYPYSKFIGAKLTFALFNTIFSGSSTPSPRDC